MEQMTDSKIRRITVIARNVENSKQNITLERSGIIGNGSFGVVFEGLLTDTCETVAIKETKNDLRYRNRELPLLREISHVNIVALKFYFFHDGDYTAKEGGLFLNLILEYLPETLTSVRRRLTANRERMAFLHIKVYMYQLFRALGYLRSLKICHRDIKPENTLVNEETGVLKLCDFGSAKKLRSGDPSVSYICSRYYRAPELLFGATHYSTQIDVWSAGCVLAELIINKPVFPGNDAIDQLVEISKLLGTPKAEQLATMNARYAEFRFPIIRAYSWMHVFKSRGNESPEAVDLVSQILQFVPHARPTPLAACAHDFFDELRLPETLWNGERQLPPLFNFAEDELTAAEPSVREKLVPAFLQEVDL